MGGGVVMIMMMEARDKAQAQKTGDAQCCDPSMATKCSHKLRRCIINQEGLSRRESSFPPYALAAKDS